MFSIFVIILAIALALLFGLYYAKLLERFYLLFCDSVHPNSRKIFFFCGILLGISTVNIFSVVGVFLLHFTFLSLIIDLLVFLYVKYSKKNNEILEEQMGNRKQRKKYRKQEKKRAQKGLAYQLEKKLGKSAFLSKLYRSLMVPLVCSCLILGYGYYNMRHLVKTDYTFYTEKEIGKDLKILLLTDIHYETIFGKETLEKYLEKWNQEHADLIVLGGDIVDESTTLEGMKEIFSKLGSLETKYGIYYVRGNHDEQQYGSNKKFSIEELERTIRASGISMVEDRFIRLGEHLVIAGRDDYSYKNRRNVHDILEGVKEDDYVIMVDHQPVAYQENQKENVDLILSGHTHAGQVFPLGLLIRLAHTSSFLYGTKNFDGMQAVVSSGVAGWGYPIRTEKHSEYVTITLKQKKKQEEDSSEEETEITTSKNGAFAPSWVER